MEECTPRPVSTNLTTVDVRDAVLKGQRDPDGQMFFRLLLMRKQQKKLPEWESLVKLYEKTGNPMHYLAMVHMILDTVVLRRGLTDLIPRAKN